jgi:tetratricopeptide (TPR) repeat protein
LLTNDSVNKLLQKGELALEQKTFVEVRVYLKMAMLRNEKRAEPYYWLSELYETQGDIREALHYYYRALDAGPTFQPTRKALRRLRQLATGTSG